MTGPLVAYGPVELVAPRGSTEDRTLACRILRPPSCYVVTRCVTGHRSPVVGRWPVAGGQWPVVGGPWPVDRQCLRKLAQRQVARDLGDFAVVGEEGARGDAVQVEAGRVYRSVGG